MVVDYRTTEQAVQAAAIALRQTHDALDWSAAIDDLIREEGLSQGQISPTGFGGKLWHAVAEAAKKVKALISLKEKVILLAPDLHHTKTPFAKGHELGHSTLPWHRKVLWVCDEHDLSQATRDQMEWEANLFSSEVLLPAPLVDQVYAQYPTSMETVLLLKQLSGASIASCAIKYAERHPRPCVLLTLEERRDGSGNPFLTVVEKGKVVSPSAAKSKLGTLAKSQSFPSNHVLYTHSRVSDVGTCELVLDGERFRTSILNNTYVIMALVFSE